MFALCCADEMQKLPIASSSTSHRQLFAIANKNPLRLMSGKYNQSGGELVWDKKEHILLPCFCWRRSKYHHGKSMTTKHITLQSNAVKRIYIFFSSKSYTVELWPPNEHHKSATNQAFHMNAKCIVPLNWTMFFHFALFHTWIARSLDRSIAYLFGIDRCARARPSAICTFYNIVFDVMKIVEIKINESIGLLFPLRHVYHFWWVDNSFVSVSARI